ncbi:nucleotidyltransferase and HEPN domain-containing protein (plasmid) [Novosphingobium resinovorum]|uniref:Nucleotidyltransferase n=1 Tax=Novosphingobium resinovorum TaxID=158500 RepID=A0A1D8AF96_9SPHN|nr:MULTISPECIES: nucleotidyltransferase and HEPN domain-containing protein [Novosphingobium]AOR80798.1 nucleotidyltransferase [Novosphingobium resinovorum]MBF7015655.1 HEPN domain-containing protein [Novosphingobium sp. HR1a]WJM30330.1 nucleotidyltransferase and HEPN domain-containing protein [Novosphingobium resinovorum]
MRTDLDHLPPAKRRELELVVKLIFEEFGDAVALAQQAWKKQARILKIILFGSHARGGWVDEPHTAKGYLSDFDLLIIVNHDRLVDRGSYWSSADERLIRERTVAGTLRTPVNFIVHTLGEVNAALSEGRYFFTDIARDGIAIYQSDTSRLAEPRSKSSSEALALTREYAEDWISTADGRLDTAKYVQSQGRSNEAAFNIHQAAERYYHGLLLSLTFYSPHTHRLGVLRSIAEQLAPNLIGVWPRETKLDRARFEKLKDAYIKARYSKHYQIENSDLDWLISRVSDLGRTVASLCNERIAFLERQAASAL